MRRVRAHVFLATERTQHTTLCNRKANCHTATAYLSELTLAGVPWVSLAEHSMTVARDHTTRVQCVPESLLDGFGVAYTYTHLLLEALQPAKHLLVGKAMKWSYESRAHNQSMRSAESR
jgi:hypothetical protein